MFKSYVKIALRSLLKYRLYAAINIVGLAIGLAMYLFSGLITDYERTHDEMFMNHDRIFTISSFNNPNRNQGSVESRGTYLALQPLIKVQLPDMQAARSVTSEVLLRVQDKSFYEAVKFVDPSFTEMFNFDYIHGAANSLEAPGHAIMTEEAAKKYFGQTDVLGKTLTINGSKQDAVLTVVGVIKKVAKNSHFNSDLSGDDKLGILAHIGTIDQFFPVLDPDNNWGWLSTDYMTYVMTDGTVSLEAVNQRINNLYLKSAPKEETDVITKLITRPLADANLNTWYSMGIPVIDIIEFLGLLVLVIAIINYANLATAQNMGRIREVGLRKTLGANRKQLLAQFLIECQSIVLISMVFSLVLIELSVPVFNNALGKVLTIDYMAIMPWLVSTTICVGLVAGAYPALVITNSSPSEAIRNSGQKGRFGSLFRSGMISIQFIISIIMLALVMVVFAQNKEMIKDSEVFPKDQIMTLDRLENETILSRKDILHKEITALNGVESAAFSSQVPFQQQNWGWDVTRDKGDWSQAVNINNMLASADFLKTYNVPIIAGRDFDENNSADEAKFGKRFAHVVINEMAVKRLGFDSPEDAIGKGFFVSESNPYELYIIGVMKDRNILGLQNYIKPFAVRWRGGNYRTMSIKLKAGSGAADVEDIQKIWKKINPEFPIEWSFLDSQFEDQFVMLRAANDILAGFAVLALALALFGMFGLAAFMAEQRTKEIGLRKILGASVKQIIPMLLFQFSRPAMWAMALAMPITFYLTERYLEIFASRIDHSIILILIASVIAIVLAWMTISVHALKVARQSPIKSLRTE